MNNITIFENSQFGSVRTLEENGQVLFCAKDVAAALGYANTRDAISRHCRGVVKRDGVSQTTNQYGVVTEQCVEMAFVPEGDIYRLIVHSKLPRAEQFEKWVFEDVLPSIRKHGMYATPEKVEEILSDPDVMIGVLQALKAERQALKESQSARLALQETVEQQQPLVDFANAIQRSEENIHVADMAKILCDKGFNIGGKRLFALLRDNGVLMSGNIPYQRYIDEGVFFVQARPFTNQYGKTTVTYTPLVTPKGQLWVAKKVTQWCRPADRVQSNIWN